MTMPKSGRMHCVLLLLAATSLSGCNAFNKLQDAYRVDPAVRTSNASATIQCSGSTVTLPARNPNTDTVGLAIFNLDTDKLHPCDAKTAYQEARDTEDAALAAGGNADKGKVARNRLQSRLLAVSDAICDKHQGDIYATANTLNVGTGFLTTVLAGAATVVTGEVAKDILAAGAGASNATRSLINEEVYQKQVTAAVIKGIRSNRESKMTTIDARRKLGNTDYSLDEAIRDVVDYHTRCSFYAGVTYLVQATERAVPSREQLTARLKALDADMKAPGADAKIRAVYSQEADALKALLALQP